MTVKKRIAKVEVVAPGSNPDIDSDIHTKVRGPVFNHIRDLYGEEMVSRISVFGTSAAKGAFKNLCTIYSIPPAIAQKVSDTIPGTKKCTLGDLLDPESDFYSAGADFRAATSGPEWRKIIEGAQKMEGRVRNVSQHPCGVLISGKPLFDTIPLLYSKDEQEPVSQWTYPECENMGLIKFDLLGLDTVDLLQLTIKYILKTKGKAPSLVDLIQGPMDDEKTFKVFSEGNTRGIFQFHTPLATDYSRILRPTRFEDLAASTALCRPGPMSIDSHMIYAARKNGEQQIKPIHPEFAQTVLEEILEETYGLIVYQEQIQIVANKIAGMSLQKADKIRKAAGKKDRALMESLGQEFKDGAIANGYSQEAAEALWHAIDGFAEYGFNKSHSVAYAINAYQCAWLKANYPVEFMSALISQQIDNREKTLKNIQEARRMGLKIGPIDINSSDVLVAPDSTGKSGFDIVFGIAGGKSISEDTAQIIISEREENGLFTSVQDVISRCYPLGVTTVKTYENLALAGAFDQFGHTRKAVVENLSSMVRQAKTKKDKGGSLFDLLSGDEDSSMTIDLSDSKEFPWIEKMKSEAKITGFYLTGHPMDYVGKSFSSSGVKSLKEAMSGKDYSTETFNVVATVSSIEVKVKKSKIVTLFLDDGETSVSAKVANHVVKGLGQYTSRRKIETAYENGLSMVSEEDQAAALDPSVKETPPIEPHEVYILNVTVRMGNSKKNEAPHFRVNDLRRVQLSDEGLVPARLRIRYNPSEEDTKFMRSNPKEKSSFVKKRTEDELSQTMSVLESLQNKNPGKTPVFLAVVNSKRVQIDKSEYYKHLIESIEDRKSDLNTKVPLPRDTFSPYVVVTEEEIADLARYFDSGFRIDKSSPDIILSLDKYGSERFDYGIYRHN